MKRDYYDILGLNRGADAAAIKKAYRQLALKYHPDKNPGDASSEAKFKEASEAYEVLADDQKRSVYDRFGHAGLEGRGFHGFTNVDDIFSSFGDIFEEFFGGFGMRGGRTRQRGFHGRDVEHRVTLSFREAAHGLEQELSIPMEGSCDACEGKGFPPGHPPISCSTCGGRGEIVRRQGFFMMSSTCHTCGGRGERIEKPCPECRGRGRVRKTKKITARIPAGVEDGMQLCLRSQGEPGAGGGNPGDLYLSLHVEPDDFFAREGDDLVATIPISFSQAALGAKIHVPSLESQLEVAVSAGTQHGDEKRVHGKGFHNVKNGNKGDFVVRFVVKTPRKLTRRQKKLFEDLLKEEE